MSCLENLSFPNFLYEDDIQTLTYSLTLVVDTDIESTHFNVKKN